MIFMKERLKETVVELKSLQISAYQSTFLKFHFIIEIKVCASSLLSNKKPFLIHIIPKESYVKLLPEYDSRFPHKPLNKRFIINNRLL